MNTAEFILDKVAPVFNRKGYVGTSLSDITNATGLTKGAIYCNFSNKEDLALKSFELNINIAISPLFRLTASKTGCINKLHAITNYHRNYYDLVKDIGGCPLLRVGVDTKFINPSLFKAAKTWSQKMVNGLTNIIKDGLLNQEIRQNIDAVKYAKIVLAMIEGSSVLAFTHNDKTYIVNAMDFVDDVIIPGIKK